MINIMLVDDHRIVINGVKSLLEKDENLKIVAEMSNGEEALEFLKIERVDLIVMDINMEIMDGISCTKEILRLYPDQKVLALSMRNDYRTIKQMLAAGAAGYLFKNCKEEELRLGVNSIINQGIYYSPEVSQTLVESFQGIKPKPNSSLEASLTTREKEVLQLILKEYSNKEIAEELFISLRTVEAHKRNLQMKTGSKNAAGLVMYALSNNLFEDI
jgi:DNA-binding NarL/FixJ family response regulator